MLGEEEGVAPIHLMVEARKLRHELPLFRMERAALEEIKLKEMMTEKWSSMLLGAERKWEVVIKSCNHRWL